VEDRNITEEQAEYFSLMADVDHTKHIGGISATNKLAELCDIQEGDVVLDVGCGVGISAVNLVEGYGCQVVGVDIMDRMIVRSQERVQREGVSSSTKFLVADARQLPFREGVFDATISESVISFIQDKQEVVDELIRVTKPGKRVGITEAIWFKKPKPEAAKYLSRTAGLPEGLLEHKEWEALLQDTDLQDIVAQSHQITILGEASNQFKRLGLANYLRILSKALKMMFTSKYRSMMKDALGQPGGDLYKHMGYGIYAGRKA
jgi:ubiquinone/menaquinone biosynthesis C-methylase UbiE